MFISSRAASLVVALLVGTTVVVAAPACGDDGAAAGTGGGGTGGNDESGGDVVYEGGTTDEALEELLAGTATTDPLETASFTAPLPGTVLPAATPATFSWAVPTQGSCFDLWPSGSSPPGAFSRAATATLGALLAGVPEAHAHGDPVNGRAYLVEFSTDGGTILRVFTSQTSYTPDDAAWTTLKGAGAAITATLTSAIFESNRVGADGGPFTGGTLIFTIAE